MTAVESSQSKKREVSRYIPREVRDQIYARDKGRCCYVSPGGRKCGSTHDLQVDHIVPFARGGDNSPSNLRLLCGKHNRLEAERVYGKKHMEQFVKEQVGFYLMEPMEQYLIEPMGQYLKEAGEQHTREPLGWYLKEPMGRYQRTSSILPVRNSAPAVTR